MGRYDVLMPPGERRKAIKRLRKAANKVVVNSAHWNLDALAEAWRAFPECYRDKEVPYWLTVLKICERMEREEEYEREMLATKEPTL